ncbi:lactonase family protein [Algoriphagus lutimaris]|uniref:lactonase family protein n=1 Tax=Algoriphagus lutimaris TaxID=613197 RepID=UPI001FAF8590|nr:lactonase family protein [Algoriphagus lutimaris]
MDKSENTYTFLIGTYTDSADQGINLLKFNPSKDILEVTLLTPDVQNPSFVIANKQGNRVFALEESAGVKGGEVLSFNLNMTSDSLELVDKMPSFGDHPCYLALSPNEKHLTVGNYTGGSLSIYEITPEGKLIHQQTIQHHGKGTNPDRQEGPHVHSTVFSPDGSRLLVADLGTNKLYNYKVSPEDEEPLSLVNELSLSAGDGPRHLVFSKGGDTIFLVQEMSATLEIIGFNNDTFTPKQRLNLLDENFKGAVGAAEVKISPDGENIYVSNRGDANTISVFKKAQDGTFSRIQNSSSGGLMPRNFNLTNDGKYLLAAHQASNDVVVFERNEENGTLALTNWKVKVHKPVYLFQLPD